MGKEESIFGISVDGYIRLTVEQLNKLEMKHLVSGLDEGYSSDQSSKTLVTGFTEWVSQDKVTITFGWDWKIEHNRGTTNLVAIGEPRVNVMVINQERDIGFFGTMKLVKEKISYLAWQEPVKNYLGIL